MVKPPGSHYTVVLASGTSIFPLLGAVILSAAKDLRSSSQVRETYKQLQRSFAALCRNSSGNSGVWKELHIQLSGLSFEPLDLVLTVLAFVVLHSFVVIFGAEAEQAID